LNGVSTVASLENPAPLLMPGIFILGFFFLTQALRNFFKEGGYFVGTPTRFLHLQSGKLRSIDWEQFSGDIEVSGSTEKGNLSLKMRTGRIVRKKNGPDRFVPEIIDMVEIQNAFEVEQLCRKRIKENDPTPTSHSTQ
jgi:hypothetical protein